MSHTPRQMHSASCALHANHRHARLTQAQHQLRKITVEVTIQKPSTLPEYKISIASMISAESEAFFPCV